MAQHGKVSASGYAPSSGYDPAPASFQSSGSGLQQQDDPVPASFPSSGSGPQQQYVPGPASFQPSEQPYVPMQTIQQPQQQQLNCNNIVVTQQPAAMIPIVVERKPNDYLVLSLMSCLFCNWICGLIALIYSMQVNSAWASGDFSRAHDNSRNAKIWSVVAIISHTVTIAVSVIIAVIYVIIAVVVAVGSESSAENYDYYYQ